MIAPSVRHANALPPWSHGHLLAAMKVLQPCSVRSVAHNGRASAAFCLELWTHKANGGHFTIETRFLSKMT